MHLGSSYGVQNVNIDISINNQKFYMSKKIVSPPNEEEKIVAAVHQNWGCVQPGVNVKVTDEMIIKYQKLDTLLNYGVEKVNSYFVDYLWIKNMLEFYFVKYSPGATNKMHEISQENMNYILSLTEMFNDDDITLLAKIGKYEYFYNQVDSQANNYSQKDSQKDSESNLHNQDSNLNFKMFQRSELSFNLDNDFNFRKWGPAINNSVELALLDAKMAIFEVKVREISEVLIDMIYGRLDFSEGGRNLEQACKTVNKKYINTTSAAIFVRKAISNFQSYFKDNVDLQQMRESFLSDCRLIIQTMLRSHEFPDPGVVIITEKGVKREMVFDFSKNICNIMIVDTFLWGKSYETQFKSYASLIVDDYDGKSQVDKFSFINGQSVEEFKRIVSCDGSNPMSNLYGLFN